MPDLSRAQSPGARSASQWPAPMALREVYCRSQQDDGRPAIGDRAPGRRSRWSEIGDCLMSFNVCLPYSRWERREGRNKEGERFSHQLLVHENGRILAII